MNHQIHKINNREVLIYVETTREGQGIILYRQHIISAHVGDGSATIQTTKGEHVLQGSEKQIEQLRLALLRDPERWTYVLQAEAES